MQSDTATTCQVSWRSSDAIGASARRAKPVAKMAPTCSHLIGAASAASIGLEAPSEV